MGHRRVAAPLVAPAFVALPLAALPLAALLLAAALSPRPGSPNVSPTHRGVRGEALGVLLPPGEALLSITARVSAGELYRGIERSRSVSAPAALLALGMLLSGACSRRSPLRLRGGRKTPSASPRVAGARAPPLQPA